jgi:hypothetical protein
MAVTIKPQTREAVLIDPMVPVPYRVLRVRRETKDTFTFELPSAPHLTRHCLRRALHRGESLQDSSICSISLG